MSPGTTQPIGRSSGRASAGVGVAGPEDRLDPAVLDEDPPVVEPGPVDDVEEVRDADQDAVGGHAASVAGTGYHAPHDHADLAPVHRRPRRRPPARRRTRWPSSSASRSTSRSPSRRRSAARPTSSAGSVTSTRADRGDGSGRPRRGLPRATGASTASRARWPARSRRCARRSRPTTATTPARVWTRGGDGPDLERRLLGLPGIGEMKAKSLIAVLGKRFGVRPPGYDDGRADLADPRRRRLGRGAGDLPGRQARPQGRHAGRAEG